MKRPALFFAALVLALALCACAQKTAPQASYSTTHYTLSMSGGKVVSDVDWVVSIEKDSSRDFVILNLTDIQLGTSAFQISFPRIRTMINALVEKVQPDLITVTGDISYGCGPAIYGICSFIDSFGIPWAPVYGNHDFENSGMSPETLAKVLANYKHCLFKVGPRSLAYDSLYGIEAFGNYVVNIVEKDGDGFEVVKSLVFLNSGTDGITELQMQWYADCMDSVKPYGEGGDVSCAAFMHIPINDYRNAANAAIKGSWYAVDLQDSYTSGPWKSGYENSFGVNHGGIANRARTNGFGALFRDKGCDLLVCGHKHENCSCIEYEGITYLFALKTGPGCYYEEGMEGGTEISIDGSGASTVRHCFYYDGKGCYYTPQDF